MRTLALAAILTAGLAHADAAWLTTRGRLPDATQVTAFAGLHEVGAGFSRDGLGAEAAWAYGDRVLELRATRGWQLTRFLAGYAGLTGLLVPQDALDLGLGPHVGLALALGVPAFSVQLGGSTGAEIFARGTARFVERVHLGLTTRLGRFSAGLTLRAGVDLSPGAGFVVRTDGAIALGWTFD